MGMWENTDSSSRHFHQRKELEAYRNSIQKKFYTKKQCLKNLFKERIFQTLDNSIPLYPTMQFMLITGGLLPINLYLSGTVTLLLN